MKKLQTVSATREQLPLILNNKPGVMLIRGAAGSGKTTTALLRLRQLATFWLQRRNRLGITAPVRILVITYNRTLRGYIESLAQEQIEVNPALQLTVSTFAKWASDHVMQQIFDPEEARQFLLGAAGPLGIDPEFALSEVDYATGRFLPQNINAYLDCERYGRGNRPRVDRRLRSHIISEVIEPYQLWKQLRDVFDWNDYACHLALNQVTEPYNVIIADETQDLSANVVRALLNHAAALSSQTFVLDAAQRIYPNAFPWREVGVTLTAASSHRLLSNHRNTIEICRFAHPLLVGLPEDDDGTLPDFTTCIRHGEIPKVIKGYYNQQVDSAIAFINQNVNLATESVAFLKPRGRGFFSYLKARLQQAGIPFVELTKASDWPEGDENVALCTMYSAKGLEFDHIFILGLSDQVTPHEDNPEDDSLQKLRRLLAMAITRAKNTVTVGYKVSEASNLIRYFVPGTFEEVDL